MIRNTQKSPPVRVEHAIFVSREKGLMFHPLFGSWSAEVIGQKIARIRSDLTLFPR